MGWPGKNPFFSVVTGLSVVLAALMAAVADPSNSASPSLPSKKAESNYSKLDFDELSSFAFIPPPIDPTGVNTAKVDSQIPASIKRWHGRNVVVTGYMLPAETRDGLVTEFMLMRYHVAVGNLDAPTINEWVIVRMKKGIPAELRLPVSIAGKMKVGAIWQNGYLVGIYELEGERRYDRGGDGGGD